MGGAAILLKAKFMFVTQVCTQVVTQFIVVTFSVLISSQFTGFCFSYNSPLISNACLFVQQFIFLILLIDWFIFLF